MSLLLLICKIITIYRTKPFEHDCAINSIKCIGSSINLFYYYAISIIFMVISIPNRSHFSTHSAFISMCQYCDVQQYGRSSSVCFICFNIFQVVSRKDIMCFQLFVGRKVATNMKVVSLLSESWAAALSSLSTLLAKSIMQSYHNMTCRILLLIWSTHTSFCHVLYLTANIVSVYWIYLHCLEQRVKAHSPSEILPRRFGGRLWADSFNVHFVCLALNVISIICCSVVWWANVMCWLLFLIWGFVIIIKFLIRLLEKRHEVCRWCLQNEG